MRPVLVYDVRSPATVRRQPGRGEETTAIMSLPHARQARNPAPVYALATKHEIGRRRLRGRAALFPALHQDIRGKPLVYLDSAATTQKPRSVIDCALAFL